MVIPYWARPLISVLEQFPGVRDVEWCLEACEPNYEAYIVFDCKNRDTLGWLSKILGESPYDLETESPAYELLNIEIMPDESYAHRMDIAFAIWLYPDEDKCELLIPVLVRELVTHLEEVQRLEGLYGDLGQSE